MAPTSNGIEVIACHNVMTEQNDDLQRKLESPEVNIEYNYAHLKICETHYTYRFFYKYYWF